MNLFYKIFIFIILSTLTLNSWAQFNYSQRAQEAHNAILNLDFNHYNELRNHHSNDEIGIYFWLDGYKNFVNYYTTSSICKSDSVINEIEKSVIALEKSPASDPFYYYVLADLQLFLSYLNLENNELLLSFQHYFKAKNLLNKGVQKYPDFEFAGKQELVQFLLNKMIDIQLGINYTSNTDLQRKYRELFKKQLEAKNPVYKREIKLLGILLYNFQFESDADIFINEFSIDEEFAQTGPLEAYATVILHKKADNYAVQRSILQEAMVLGFNDKLNILNLWNGIALLNSENDSALLFLNKFIFNQQNNKGVQFARYNTSKYYFLKGDIAKSNGLNHLIKQSNGQFTSEDKQAQYEIGNAEFWTAELIQARLLFDGGAYKKAHQVLLEHKDKVGEYSQEQKLEYAYRMARIYDKFGDLEKAKKFYLMVINSKLDKRFYYPAYAAFYLGNMYSNYGDIENANIYFRTCLQLDSPIYKSAIHKKAKQALN